MSGCLGHREGCRVSTGLVFSGSGAGVWCCLSSDELQLSWQGVFREVLCLINEISLSKPFPYSASPNSKVSTEQQVLTPFFFESEERSWNNSRLFPLCNYINVIRGLGCHLTGHFYRRCLHSWNTFGAKGTALLQGNGIDGCHGNGVKSRKDYLIMHYPMSETGSRTGEQTAK